MKKILLPLILIGTIDFTHADYTIHIPLEKYNGGGLPNGSINITPFESWAPTLPSYTTWVDSTLPYDCSNWNPDPNTVTIGQNFVQTATDCIKEQSRIRQNREQEANTLVYRNIGEPITETQIINTSDTRNSVGSLETWTAITPTYTTWINSGTIYGCNNWSPAPSTVDSGVGFTQTATDCEQDQTRNRQNREQETTTLSIRNNGSVIIENQTITNQTNTRAATGTKPVSECRAWNSGSYVVIDTGAGSTMFVWNSGILGYVQSTSTGSTLNSGGYRYSISTLGRVENKYDEIGGQNRYHNICRILL